jgi:hypothetical protein
MLPRDGSGGRAGGAVPTIIGYRAWNVGRDASLRSITGRDVWRPEPMRAFCTATPFQKPTCGRLAPQRDCDCGLHAYHDVETCLRRGPVHGIVAGWGRVIVHCNCWRAQWAQVVALINTGWDPALVRRIARRYHVPVVPRREAEAFAAEFGAPVPRHLIPPRHRDYSADRRAA